MDALKYALSALLLVPALVLAQQQPIPNTAVHVICDNGTCGGGSAFADSTVFTAGATGVNIFAGVFNDALTDATSGTAVAPRMTAKRGLHVNFRDASGAEIGVSANPFFATITNQAATTSAVAVRCVNTAGNAFEACGGTGGGGGGSGDGAILDGVNATIKATVTGANALKVDGSAVTQPVSGPLTDAQLRLTAVPVSGTFWQATQPVSGTFWQATQPVSGPLTDTQLRAADVPVSGAFWQATQPVSGTFWQATQPVSGTVTANAGTGTFLVGDGTGPLTIDGTVTANAGTNLNTSALALSATQTDRTQKTQLTDGTRDGTIKASSTAAVAGDTSYVVAFSPNSALPTGSNAVGSTSNTPATAVTGSITSTTCPGTGCVSMASLAGMGSLLWTEAGTYGGANITMEVAADGSTWIPLACTALDNSSTSTTTGALTNTTQGWSCPVRAGLTDFRVRATAITSGTVSIRITANAASYARSWYGTVQDEGTALALRSTLNLTGTSVTCTDDSANGRTNCAVAAGGSGSFSATQIEINFDTCGLGTAIAKRVCSTTITDAAVSGTSKILITQAGDAATGRQADENEMDPIECSAQPASGIFTLRCMPGQGAVAGKYKLNYTIG